MGFESTEITNGPLFDYTFDQRLNKDGWHMFNQSFKGLQSKYIRYNASVAVGADGNTTLSLDAQSQVFKQINLARKSNDIWINFHIKTAGAVSAKALTYYPLAHKEVLFGDLNSIASSNQRNHYWQQSDHIIYLDESGSGIVVGKNKDNKNIVFIVGRSGRLIPFENAVVDHRWHRITMHQYVTQSQRSRWHLYFDGIPYSDENGTIPLRTNVDFSQREQMQFSLRAGSEGGLVVDDIDVCEGEIKGARCYIDQKVVDFGGAFTTLTLKVINYGIGGDGDDGGLLTISDIILPKGSSFSVSPKSLQLHRGEQHQLRVRFTATTFGAYKEDMTIVTNVGTFKVSLVGQRGRPYNLRTKKYYDTIQAALNDGSDGAGCLPYDVIHVYPGIYRENIVFDCDDLGKQLIAPVAGVTIIGSGEAPVVLFTNGGDKDFVNADAKIEGFVLKRAVVGEDADEGIGVAVEGNSVTIKDCHFINTAYCVSIKDTLRDKRGYDTTVTLRDNSYVKINKAYDAEIIPINISNCGVKR